MPESTTLIPTSLVKGQTVFLVSVHRRIPETKTVTVEKVGREWVTLSNGSRCKKAVDYSWPVDAGGYAPHTYIWINQEAYEENEERLKVWRELRKVFDSWHPPDRYSLTQLQGILAVVK